ncbi:hypothetical protein HK100_004368, partial [Physocladia obscura]
KNELESEASASTGTKEGYFLQKVDHFGSQTGINGTTFLQYYILDDTFYTAGGPIFLYLQGESALTSSIVTSNELPRQLASRYNGLLIALEHRFYGSALGGRSTPTADLSNASLKLLTSQQALEDTATFIASFNKTADGVQYGITALSPWITLGGSYAGSLSAWLIQKYPDLVFAAHASSAPVLPQLNRRGQRILCITVFLVLCSLLHGLETLFNEMDQQVPNNVFTPRQLRQTRPNPPPIYIKLIQSDETDKSAKDQFVYGSNEEMAGGDTADDEVIRNLNDSRLATKFMQQKARLASYDTGRTVTVPKSHFSPNQSTSNLLPGKNDIIVNVEIMKHAKPKYFTECGVDLKRDSRFVEQRECVIRSSGREEVKRKRINRLSNENDEWNFSRMLAHYDLTAAHDSLRGLLWAWSKFAKKEEILWWISHGEMLGWFWNAKFLPWDVDLDIQMSTLQMLQLVQYNQTLLAGRYLIDVNPALVVRTPQKTDTIDARVIDITSGFFMDITALSQLATESSSESVFVRCKSPHDYHYDKLMPLQETMLEGVKVWRPRSAVSILVEEYREKALVDEFYSPHQMAKGYTWNRDKQEWCNFLSGKLLIHLTSSMRKLQIGILYGESDKKQYGLREQFNGVKRRGRLAVLAVAIVVYVLVMNAGLRMIPIRTESDSVSDSNRSAAEGAVDEQSPLLFLPDTNTTTNKNRNNTAASTLAPARRIQHVHFLRASTRNWNVSFFEAQRRLFYLPMPAFVETPLSAGLLLSPPVKFTISIQEGEEKQQEAAEDVGNDHFQPNSTKTLDENLPVLDFNDAAARFALLDTGNFLSVPESHFGLAQPPPPIYNYNQEYALVVAKGDVKYFYECGADAKRDFRFVARGECTVDNTADKPEGWVSPGANHNLDIVHEALTGILSAWARFCSTYRITWWISHGEMLGWFWNGKLLPWDADLDIQMPIFQLIQLIRYNQTLLEGRFLIDVNPSILVRSPQSQNTIDARVVDTKSGYLMDITGLTALHKSKAQLDADGESILLEHSNSSILVYCKSPHAYLYEDLFPLHETLLDGIKVWRPRAAIKILKEEYSINALVSEKYRVQQRSENFIWDKRLRLWIPQIDDFEDEEG